MPPGTARRVVGMARPFRAGIVAFLAVTLVAATAAMTVPLVLRTLIDQGISARRSDVVVRLALVVGALAVAEALLVLLQRGLAAHVGEGLVLDLRTRVFRHVQRQPVAFFTRSQTGSLVSRLNADIVGAQSAFTDLLANVVANLLVLGFVVVAMLALSWRLTIAALVALPALALPARLLGRRLAALSRERLDHLAALNAIMAERFDVSGALLAKLFVDPEREAEAFERRAGRVRDLGVDVALHGRLLISALALAAGLAAALVYGWGGTLAVEGRLQLGTLVALTAYLARLWGPAAGLSSAHADVATTLVSFARVFEVLDLEPLVRERPGARDLPRGPTAVTFEHVHFAYPPPSRVSVRSLSADRGTPSEPPPVLRDVSLHIEPGRLVALVGPSGAGKTTLSALVPRLYDVTAGAVRLGGVDVRDLTAASLRASVGVVTQDAHLFHDTLRANLLIAGPGATDAQLHTALARAQAADVVASLPDGLDTVVGARGHRLSGGEKQRVALARIVLKEPDVVVLDEATAHLDTASERAVQRALATVLRGRTSLVIAHRLSTVRRADRIVVVAGGRIVEEGTHEELLRRGRVYARLHRLQFADQDGTARPVVLADRRPARPDPVG